MIDALQPTALRGAAELQRWAAENETHDARR